MAEEAVVRIILEGGGSTGGFPVGPDNSGSDYSTQTQGGNSGASSTRRRTNQTRPPFDPVEAARKKIERENQRAAVQEEYNKLKPPEAEPAFDPLEVAKKRIKREEQRAAVDAEYAKLKPLIPDLQPAFDPLEVAKKRLERERQRAAVEEEYNKLNPPAPPPSAHDLALKRLEAEKKRQEIEREYAKLNPQDPRMAMTALEAAKKRRENERRAAQIDEAYKKEYGGASERGSLDLIFARISTLRGTLGGLLGTTVGATLDVYHILRREQADQERKKKRKQLLKEADEAEADRYASAADKYDNDPSSATRAGGISGLFRLAKTGLGFGNRPSKNARAPLPSASLLIGKGADTDSIARTSDPYAEAGGIVGAISKFGGFIPVIGAAVVAIGAGVAAISSLMSSVNRMADNYGQYNPEIAQAQSLAEIRKTLNDMQRANAAGGELAKFIEAQSQMEQRWEDIKLKISMVIIPVLTKILEAVAALLKIAEDDKFDVMDPATVILNDPTLTRMGQGATSPLDQRDVIGGLNF